MKTTHVNTDNTETAVEKSSRCAACGWPGLGKMPTGVRMIRGNEKHVLIGQLSYYPINRVLCAVCQEMESAVTTRPWFVGAHAEYLDDVKAKRRLLDGK
jgi:hypothetical protein